MNGDYEWRSGHEWRFRLMTGLLGPKNIDPPGS
jgi:hypothetical protein